MISAVRHWLVRALASLLIVVVSLSGSSLALAEDDPQVLLDRMSHSFRELNYHGTFSYQQGSSTESLRMVHTVVDGEEFERLEYLDGEKREIVRRGHDLHCIHPGHQMLRLYKQQLPLGASASSAAHAEESASLVGSAITGLYQFNVVGSGRVAGREVVNLVVSPRDSHRFGYHLSLDKETGLLLRSELVGPGKAILERFQFVEITIGESLAPELFASADVSHQAGHIEPSAQAVVPPDANGQGWTVGWFPLGFTSSVANLKFVSGDMVTFTDGLASFSVFLERDVDVATMQRGVEGHAQKGATTAYSRALLLAGRPHRVTVVGEIPAQTARQIAQSVKLVAAR